jgi:phosphatidylglycerol---prolipoprotein diacylglyceryl transferase
MHPEFIKIGNFVVYLYGVLVAAGVLVSSLIFQKTAGEEGYSQPVISKLIFWTVIFGIAGGRILHVFIHIAYYYRHFWEIFYIRNGGLAIQGAIFSSLVFLIVYSKMKELKPLKTLDMMALSVPAGQALGRIGCFFNGCCYGKITDLPIGVMFPHLTEKVHPTQLYYTLCYIALFFILKTLYRKKAKQGLVFGSYIMGFALIRYSIDFLRGDLVYKYMNFYPTQIIGILVFAFGAIWTVSIIFGDRKET